MQEPGGKQFYVYIASSLSRTIYIGVTNNLVRRMYEHKHNAADGFTAKYNVNRLVYYEEAGDPLNAIAREKQLKGWRREKKLRLVESVNYGWDDLSENWYDADTQATSK